MLPDKHPTQVDGFDHHKHRVSNQSLHLTLHPQHHTPQDIFQSSCLQSISVNTPPPTQDLWQRTKAAPATWESRGSGGTSCFEG